MSGQKKPPDLGMKKVDYTKNNERSPAVRGRALAARNCGLTPQLPRLEGRVRDTGGPPGPTGFDPLTQNCADFVCTISYFIFTIAN